MYMSLCNVLSNEIYWRRRNRRSNACQLTQRRPHHNQIDCPPVAQALLHCWRSKSVCSVCFPNGQAWAWDPWMGDRGLPTERHNSSVRSSLELDHFCSSCSLFCDASSCCSSLSLTGCSNCRSSYYYLSCCSSYCC